MNKKLLVVFSTILVVFGLVSESSQAESCAEKTKVDRCQHVVTGIQKTKEDQKAICGNYYIIDDGKAIVCQESTDVNFDCGPMMYDIKTCTL